MQIAFDQNLKFKIYPDLSVETRTELVSYISTQQNLYSQSGGFFWKLDLDSISANTNNPSVSVDFQDHLINLVSWLYQRNHMLSGSFYVKKSPYIEYTEITSTGVIDKRLIIDLDHQTNIRDKILASFKSRKHKYNRMKKKIKRINKFIELTILMVEILSCFTLFSVCRLIVSFVLKVAW